MSELFIPKKIKVGYQKREGTYTGRLAYVIYVDNKGVLRKEKSWQGWRDEKIKADDFDNTPQDGFCLNKDVKRYNWSHFGSNRSYIRIYDPRGIEFEVTPENLIGILTETDCLKRGLEGKFVYAWQGPELVLLPCCSEAFTEATKNTERQDQDISARDLKPGHSYTTKKGEEVIYIGRFPWYEWSNYRKAPRKATKQHIFAHPTKPQYGSIFFNKGDVKFLAVLNSSDPVMNYAELVDEWKKDIRSVNIEKWEFTPETLTMEDVFGSEVEQSQSPFFKRNDFIEASGESITFWTIYAQQSYGSKIVRYTVSENGTLNTKTMEYTTPDYSYNRNYYNSYGCEGQYKTKEQIMEKVAKSVKVKMIFSSGKKVNVKTIGDVCR